MAVAREEKPTKKAGKPSKGGKGKGGKKEGKRKPF